MPRKSTHSHALDALTRRARSTRELERWLAERDHAPDEIAATIERLTASGLLNDLEFARSFVRSRALDRGMSRRRIQAELARRGVERDVADQAIAEVMAEEEVDERVMVEAAAATKMRSLAKCEPEVRRQRLFAYLARRGHAPDLVRDVVRRLVRRSD